MSLRHTSPTRLSKLYIPVQQFEQCILAEDGPYPFVQHNLLHNCKSYIPRVYVVYQTDTTIAVNRCASLARFHMSAEQYRRDVIPSMGRLFKHINVVLTRDSLSTPTLESQEK